MSDGTTAVTIDTELTSVQADHLVFIPMKGQTGTATFQFITTDNTGNVSTPGIATINIKESNTAPVRHY